MINVLPNPDFVRVCEIDYYRETYESSLPFRPKCSRASVVRFPLHHHSLASSHSGLLHTLPAATIPILSRDPPSSLLLAPMWVPRHAQLWRNWEKPCCLQ
jgi:hypothetical protein